MTTALSPSELAGRSTDFIALIAAAGRVGFWEWDLSSGALRGDAVMHRLHGVTYPVPAERSVSDGSLWPARVHPDDRGEFERQVEGARQRRTVLSTRLRIVRPDGLIRTLQLDARIVAPADPDAAALRMIGTAEDVSDNVAAESIAERLAACRRELTLSRGEFDRFAFVASHDLKAPLRGIDQLASWIIADLDGQIGADTVNHLRLIRSRIRRMELLLTDLLAYSKVSRITDDPVLTDTRALVEGAFAGLPHGGRFELVISGEMPVLKTLNRPLELILRHLMENAVKHHDRPEGRIEVSAMRAGDDYQIAIGDDGPGIPAEYHARVFDLFQTLRPRDELEATGVGLALVQKGVAAVGGRVALESGPGRGTTIRIWWPTDEKLRRLIDAGS
jgi:signal transduction histidine kinase